LNSTNSKKEKFIQIKEFKNLEIKKIKKNKLGGDKGSGPSETGARQETP
jgi:hypothetical protein